MRIVSSCSILKNIIQALPNHIGWGLPDPIRAVGNHIGAEGEISVVGFGVNVNNREPLIAPEYYSLDDLLRQAELVEEAGFDSVWVGDSLFSKPRYEAMMLLSAIAQRTSRVRLGTACLVSSTRNPLYLALEWATLDVLSNGRTIFGPCMGNPEQGVRREFEALGLDFGKRADIFEEGLASVRDLLTTGKTNFQGQYYRYDNVEFYSGTEKAPLVGIQQPPPFWIVSNPRLIPKRLNADAAQRVIGRAARRLAAYGDGWMTCCRARHPEEFREQRQVILEALRDAGRDTSTFTMAYQVTMNIAGSQAEAERDLGNYIGAYYPELSKSMDLGEWGPTGTADDVARWIQEFIDAGVTYFICRFGSMDQSGQVKRFAEEILPRFQQAKG